MPDRTAIVRSAAFASFLTGVALTIVFVNLCTLFEGGLWDSEHGECGAAQPALCGT